MNVVDICSIVIIILGALAGFKKGAIKGLIQLIGLIAIVIVSYQFKGYFANIMIKYLPFFNFSGPLKDLYAINFLIYEGIAFVVIFILLYCVLNILINLSGIIDLLIKMTIILEIPSKIIGIVIGAIESLMFVFVIAFALLQVGPTQKYIMESNFTRKIVERTPIVNSVFAQGIVASEEIYNTIKESQDAENKTEANLNIIRSLIRFGVVDARDIQIAINANKLPGLSNVVVASGDING
ncbi:MAG: CvpA family protein [Bacilli bacterium]|nr:CvpA family protein [Bacilli bacterium]